MSCLTQPEISDKPAGSGGQLFLKNAIERAAADAEHPAELFGGEGGVVIIGADEPDGCG